MAMEKDATQIIEDTFRFLFGMMKITNAERLVLECKTKEKDVVLTVRKKETPHNPKDECDTISLTLDADENERGLDLSKFKRAYEETHAVKECTGG